MESTTGRLWRFVVTFMLVLPMLATSPSAALAQATKTINLQIIVDQSGSMAAATDTGALRIDAAKTVLNEVIAQIPEEEGVNVGLRVYGHRGNNQPAGQAESCVSSDLLVPMQGVDKASLTSQVNALQPVGWTPLGYALEQAANDFTEPASENVVNAIIMVTDGLETCGADPAVIAGQLKNSPAGITTHVIGFGTQPEELAILQSITQASGGQLLDSNNAGQLMAALFEILEELDVVAETGTGETRNSPLGIGRPGQIGDYVVSVISVMPNANEFIASANSNNIPPREGHQYFVARVSVTYMGTVSGLPTTDLSFKTVGQLSRSYSDQEDDCGDYRYVDDRYTVNELFEGGTAEINLCWEIDIDDVTSLVMYVEEPWNFESERRVWWSLGNPIAEPVNPDAPQTASPEPTIDQDEVAQAPDVEPVNQANASPSVRLDDAGFHPSEVTVPADSNFSLTVTNYGTASCNLVLQGYPVPLEVGELPPGSESKIETSFPTGRYPFYCTGPDDAGGGETGILIAE